MPSTIASERPASRTRYLDDLHVWGGYQPDARACPPPIVPVC